MQSDGWQRGQFLRVASRFQQQERLDFHVKPGLGTYWLETHSFGRPRTFCSCPYMGGGGPGTGAAFNRDYGNIGLLYLGVPISGN